MKILTDTNVHIPKLRWRMVNCNLQVNLLKVALKSENIERINKILETALVTVTKLCLIIVIVYVMFMFYCIVNLKELVKSKHGIH